MQHLNQPLTGTQNCIETLLERLEAGRLSVTEAERLHNEGHHLLNEMRTLLMQEVGNVIEREG